MMYKCPRCLESKPQSEFHRSSTVKRGFQYYCKPCQNELNRIKREYRKQHGPSIIISDKVCAKCNNRKPISQFPIKRDASDGYVSYCKPCWVKITKLAQARQKKS